MDKLCNMDMYITNSTEHEYVKTRDMKIEGQQFSFQNLYWFGDQSEVLCPLQLVVQKQ
jgi:hypothetical protein